jgi:hypothetical protein
MNQIFFSASQLNPPITKWEEETFEKGIYEIFAPLGLGLNILS